MKITKEEMRQTKIKILKEMHEYIKNHCDENTYYCWTTAYLPDCPDEEDFEFIVDDDEFWLATCTAFGELTKGVRE